MRRLLLIITIFLYLAGVGWATNYYVDSAADLGGDGTTQALTGANCAFKTIAQVNAASFSGDDVISFKKGCTWQEQLTVPSSGTSGHPITFNSYGSGDDPIIYRSTLYNTWSLWSLISDGGFEVYTVGSPNDTWSNWYSTYTVDANETVKADTTITHGGLTSCKMTGVDATHYSRMRNGPTLAASTQHYLSVYGRVDNSTNSEIEIRLKDGNNNVYLKPDGTWQAGAVSCISFNGVTANEWTNKNITFTTQAGAGNFLFEIYNFGPGTSYVDDVYLIAGTGLTTPYIWYGSFNQSYYFGAVKNGSLIPQHARGSLGATYTSITDGYFYTNSSIFLIRDDSGSPGAVYVGARLVGIYINSKNYISLDGISVQNPGGGVTSNGTYNSGILIAGTSDHISVSNSMLKNNDTFGISSENTTSNVDYDNLVATINGSTGIYSNSQVGSIQNCQSYDNGKTIGYFGDCGGIGITTGGNIDVVGNVVHDNGLSSNNADMEISVAGAVAPVNIRRNYIYNAVHGGIQLLGSGSIENNIVTGYGTSSFLGAATGKYSGIKLGTSDGVTVYNNILANGSVQDSANAAICIVDQVVTNVLIKNNIIFDNACSDVFIKIGATVTGLVSTNNCYYGNTSGNPWYWKGTNCATLNAWKTASGLSETGTVESDPLFLNAGGSYALDTDFKLQATSPSAVLRGAATGTGVSTDYGGRTRKSTPSMGAWEWLDGGGLGPHQEPKPSHKPPWRFKPRSDLDIFKQYGVYHG